MSVDALLNLGLLIAENETKKFLPCLGPELWGRHFPGFRTNLQPMDVSVQCTIHVGLPSR